MAVEQFTVALGTSSAYDQVSAVIRFATAPVIGQAFTADLGSGIISNFEVESIRETVRSATESSYAITGREQRCEFLYRPVDFNVNAVYHSEGGYGLPSAVDILYAAGLTGVFDAPTFTPTAQGMGWKLTGTYTAPGCAMQFRIKEPNMQSLLNKIFGWSNEFGKRKICWYVRAGLVYVWELQRSNSTYVISEAKTPTIRITKQVIRKFSETTDTSGTDVTTPTGTISLTNIYTDVPFSGSFYFGEASMAFANGVLVKETGNEWETTYQYGSGPVLTQKTHTVTNKKITTTTYQYSTIGNRDEQYLCMETTTSQTYKDGGWTTDKESTKVQSQPLGNGFFGQTATRYMDQNVVETQTSISRGSPGGTASQWTQKEWSSYKWTVTNPTDGTAGYVLAPTRIPIEEKNLADEYLAELEWMNGKTETQIEADTLEPYPFNPVQGKIVCRGVEYYGTESTISMSSEGTRQKVAGVRWD